MLDLAFRPDILTKRNPVPDDVTTFVVDTNHNPDSAEPTFIIDANLGLSS